MDEEKIGVNWVWKGSGLDWRTMRTTPIRMDLFGQGWMVVIEHQLVDSQEFDDDNNCDVRTRILAIGDRMF
ncbi:hypothetical protein L3Y34_008818 [Caenorhabditis briggsae]|uniref:Uncharacterized protein n=1 Tax=Caenorhabditis briggsae TaxID=6238 RepID=A0AAE9AAE8_CAEBR|nr:hypothetical protein L3Y34_008818 [Caenorhabditis briggsae]